MPTLKVSVTSTAQQYWVAVDDQDVDFDNGGLVTVPAGEHHLFWWMRGVAGNSVSITVTSQPGGAVCTEVKKSKIPPPYTLGGGVKKFSV